MSLIILHSILSAKISILCGTNTKRCVEHDMFLHFLYQPWTQKKTTEKNSIVYLDFTDVSSIHLINRLTTRRFVCLWALTDSNRRPSACKADALNQLS